MNSNFLFLACLYQTQKNKWTNSSHLSSSNIVFALINQKWLTSGSRLRLILKSDLNLCIYFLCLVLIGKCILGISAETPAHLIEEKQQISFYRGYLLWQEYIQRPGMTYDLEQVIAGMRAAENGEKLEGSEEQLHTRIRKFQEELLVKQAKENLIDAETFLANIAKENAIEVIPQKLYYKQLKNGLGKVINLRDTPLLTYSAFTYNRWGESEMISFDSPLTITLQDTIPGFAQGVAGMLEGEVRMLYIHPDLAYGIYGKLDPNQLIIFKVEIIQKSR